MTISPTSVLSKFAAFSSTKTTPRTLKLTPKGVLVTLDKAFPLTKKTTPKHIEQAEDGFLREARAKAEEIAYAMADADPTVQKEGNDYLVNVTFVDNYLGVAYAGEGGALEFTAELLVSGKAPFSSDSIEAGNNAAWRS